MPFAIKYAKALIISEQVYIGGGYSGGHNIVVKYDMKSGECVKLPRSAVGSFTMASVNGQLMLVGGEGDRPDIQLWDHASDCWTTSHYPNMPTGRSSPAAIGYKNTLIVACGGSSTTKVEVLDCSSHQWYTAQSVPVGGYYMTSVVIGDHVYISSYCWIDGESHVLSAHLPTLLSDVTSAPYHSSTLQIWQELPTPPVRHPALLVLQDHLLLVGEWVKRKEIYRYEPEKKKWSMCARLPVGMCAPSCVVLPSGELFVAGGDVGGVGLSQQVWVGTLE